MIQAKRQQLELVLLYGALLYNGLGVAAYLVGEVRDPSAYLGFPLELILNFSLAFALARSRWEGQVPSLFVATGVVYCVAHTFFFFPATTGGVFHGIVCFGLLMAAVDVSILLTTRVGLVLQLSAIALTVPLIRNVEGFGSLVVAAPLLLLLAWKFGLYCHVRVNQAEREQQRQQEAFRATVVTLNHEFNNLSAICQPLLQRIRGGPGAFESDELDMLDRNLRRLVKAVKSLRSVKRYEEVAYVGETKMVRIEEEKEGA